MHQIFRIQLLIMSPLVVASFILLAPLYFITKLFSKKFEE
jgi:hypothetical protein